MKKNKTMKKILGKYIESDSEKGSGELRFIGTRIAVEDALHLVQIGYTPEKVALAYHGLILKEAVEEAIALAANTLLEHARNKPNRSARRTRPQSNDSARRKYHRAGTRKTAPI